MPTLLHYQCNFLKKLIPVSIALRHMAFHFQVRAFGGYKVVAGIGADPSLSDIW